MRQALHFWLSALLLTTALLVTGAQAWASTSPTVHDTFTAHNSGWRQTMDVREDTLKKIEAKERRQHSQVTDDDRTEMLWAPEPLSPPPMQSYALPPLRPNTPTQAWTSVPLPPPKHPIA